MVVERYDSAARSAFQERCLWQAAAPGQIPAHGNGGRTRGSVRGQMLFP
jgi:hypothetical protein